jgi:hypothetical protein
MASCAIAELANAIKAAATKNFFMLILPNGRGVPAQTTRAGYLQYSISPDKLLKASISGTRV